MIVSILDERNKLLSYPLRKFGPYLQDQFERDTPVSTVGAAILFAYAAAPTFVGNVLMPGHLIGMGIRPRPVFEGLSRYIAHVHPPSGAYWLEPVFSVKHGSSSASKVGQRLGKRIAGKAGVKIGARVAGRLIPGVGWALLAYDVYDIAYNRSLWGFDF